MRIGSINCDCLLELCRAQGATACVGWLGAFERRNGQAVRRLLSPPPPSGSPSVRASLASLRASLPVTQAGVLRPHEAPQLRGLHAIANFIKLSLCAQACAPGVGIVER